MGTHAKQAASFSFYAFPPLCRHYNMMLPLTQWNAISRGPFEARTARKLP